MIVAAVVGEQVVELCKEGEAGAEEQEPQQQGEDQRQEGEEADPA